MNRDEVMRRLAEGRSSLAPFGVVSLFLFGSVARGEESANSDVDLLVEFERPVSLIAFARLRRVLSGLLGCRVDLVTRGALKRQLRDEILAEAVRAA